MSRSTPLIITIPEPCSQDWDQMRETDCGRFCDHCQHIVADLSGMSDAALLSYLQNNDTACGRLRVDQLNRLHVPATQPRRNWWPQFILSLGMLWGLPKEAAAQAPQQITALPDPGSAPVTAGTATNSGNAAGAVISIEGVLIDAQSNPVVSGAIEVSTMSGEMLGGAISDFDGLYKIEPLPDALMGQQIQIRYRAYGQDTSRVFSIDKYKNLVPQTTIVYSRELSGVTGGMMIRVHRTPWQRFKRKVRRFFVIRHHAK